MGVMARLAVLLMDGFSGLGVTERRTLFFGDVFKPFPFGKGTTVFGAFSVLTGVPAGVAYSNSRG